MTRRARRDGRYRHPLRPASSAPLDAHCDPNPLWGLAESRQDLGKTVGSSPPSPPRNAFPPNFCGLRATLGVVVAAQLLALVMTLTSATSLDSLYHGLAFRSLFILWVALCGALLLCIVGRWLRALPLGWAALASWSLVQLVTLGASLVVIALFADTWPDLDRPTFVLRNLGLSGIVTALGLHYLYIQHLWRAQVEAESQARFQALQARIRPHFLFNSMNTIAHLTRADPALAEEVVQDLADLFRASLSDSRRQSTLGDELELARGYLRIEGQRLGERLRVEWDLEGLPEAAPLPRLVLQPLLENAIYHGVEPSQSPGRILIAGRYRRGQVNLSIRNTLPPDAAPSHREGNRMAIDNTRQRLAGFFEDRALLAVGGVEGDYQVRLTFPYPWRPG